MAAAGTLALLVGAVRLPADPAVLMIGPLVAGLAVAVVLATGPARPGPLAPAATIGAGAASIALTAWLRTIADPGTEPDAATGLWILLEPALLLVLVYAAVRWSPPRAAIASAAAAGTATALIVQRMLTGEPFLSLLAASALWLVPALVAGAAAWYLRWSAAERERTVERARQDQRLSLAGELHDFVAHDVSEIVARAQAGRMVLAGDDPKLATLLEQIETAGVRALESMDRTVHALQQDTARHPVGGLDDIDALARRFAASGDVAVVVDRRLPGGAGRENGAVAYRAVVEALTNVRRHAPTAAKVSIVLAEEDGWLRVTVADDGRGAPRSKSRASAGLGLPGITERAERLGGIVEAGPREPRGWQVAVRLPLGQGAST
ncbi:Signal transduction histidine kinase [Glycomyces harbinensis]|uniref:histidine kinase n=1 Tax=Glycomyces harbinensis TaxID=58114 RepID=A0A1G6RS16_9ACTN|nr:Signal transduction histidine kinase [Glycomyces harbinensis]